MSTACVVYFRFVKARKVIIEGGKLTDHCDTPAQKPVFERCSWTRLTNQPVDVAHSNNDLVP